MKTWFDDSDSLYWNSMLVLRTMFPDGIIDKKDIEKADKYLAKKYKISKGSLVRIYILESALSNDVPKKENLCNGQIY